MSSLSSVSIVIIVIIFIIFIIVIIIVHSAKIVYIQHISIDLCDPSIPVVVSQSIRVIQTTMRKRTQRLPSSVTELQIAPAKQCRVKGVCYNWKGNKRVWDGRQLRATCAHSECNTRPTFNVEGETTSLYCKAHATEDMVNIKSKRCAHSECNKQPTFNVEGETKALYCKDHATEGMVDILNKRCANSECNKQPTFNVEGETTALYCKTHATEGMVDIVNKRCANSECNKHPTFDVEGETTALYCKIHATEGMVDVVNKRCASNEDGIICPILANRKYRNYCTHCFINRFPNDPLTKQIRTKSKENIVRDYINENFEGFLHDKSLETAHCDCSLRRRIDHRKLIDGTMLAIETDEHQHRSYDPTDEEHRYDDLMCGLTCKWIYIRFNPDSYRDSHGNSHNPDLCCRLKDLYIAIQTQIDRIRNNENHDLVEIIPLYYDGWEGRDYSIPCV